MSDFDFDELDRAVNGALSTSPTPEPSSPQGEPTPQEPQEPGTSRPSPAPATRRSSGRFMDMVHPTSDMRSSRPETATTPEPKLEETSSEASGSMSFESTPINEQSIDGAVSQPLESPFLPDAKVEKRPLGGVGVFPPSTPETAPFEARSSESESSADPHLMPDPIDFAQQNQQQPEQPIDPVESPLEEKPQEPADLTESTVEEEKSPLSDDITPEAQLETRLADIESETPEAIDLPTEVDTTHPQPEMPVESEVPTGPTSISPQYKEQPSSTQESGAIFDTEAYHQPLMHHATKKKSGAWVILWILILVILGAGAGVAFYLYILPTL